MAKVYTVNKITATVHKFHHHTLAVVADGTVRSGGYSDPTLARRVYVAPPADGIQDYDFEAVPPQASANQAITPIAAKDEWKEFPAWVVGVRVHADTNAKEIML